MKIILIILMLLHGLIHLMGFAKAFKLGHMSQLSQPVSKMEGAGWLSAAALFLTSLAFYADNKSSWWIIAGAALVISQVLIIRKWQDARFGTIANVIILVPVFFACLNAQPGSFSNLYHKAVTERIVPLQNIPVVSDSALQDLPGPVAKYLRYTGVVGKPAVVNLSVTLSGQMRTSIDGKWIDITAQQFNFYDDPARLFLIKSSLYGVPFEGLHQYTGSEATMKIKVAHLVEVADAHGEKMNQSETVTLFNDMCFMAPATLLDKNINWEPIDSLTVKATYTNRGHTIHAVLYFNSTGELINFSSPDRYLSSDGKRYVQYPWSTPLGSYRDYGGWRLASYGEAIWETPDGPFIYAKFKIESIRYNNQLIN